MSSACRWADLISALQKVARVLDLKGKYRPDAAVTSGAGGVGGDTLQLNFIPRSLSITLAKRLAQCLNSGLPSGVHLKAAEVLDLIFARLGPQGLVPQLSIWSMGLLPLLQHASSRVKPVLLTLLEKYYVPLGARLLPALPGLLLALLPGMEEETADTRDKVLELLEAVRAATATYPAHSHSPNSHLHPHPHAHHGHTVVLADHSVFMRCVWRLLLNCPQVRLATVNYLAVMLPNPAALVPAGATAAGGVYGQQLQLSRFLSSPRGLCVSALLAANASRSSRCRWYAE